METNQLRFEFGSQPQNTSIPELLTLRTALLPPKPDANAKRHEDMITQMQLQQRQQQQQHPGRISQYQQLQQ
eukprot:Ihof_evm1s169 gene=Ihof_evmTU1s169